MGTWAAGASNRREKQPLGRVRTPMVPGVADKVHGTKSVRGLGVNDCTHRSLLHQLPLARGLGYSMASPTVIITAAQGLL